MNNKHNTTSPTRQTLVSILLHIANITLIVAPLVAINYLNISTMVIIVTALFMALGIGLMHLVYAVYKSMQHDVVILFATCILITFTGIIQFSDHNERTLLAHQHHIYESLAQKSPAHKLLVPHFRNCQSRIYSTNKESECLSYLKDYAEAIIVGEYQQVFIDLQTANWSNG